MNTEKALILMRNANRYLQDKVRKVCSCGQCFVCAYNHLQALAFKATRKDRLQDCPTCGNTTCQFRASDLAPSPCPYYRRRTDTDPTILANDDQIASLATEYVDEMTALGLAANYQIEVFIAAINFLRLKHRDAEWQNTVTDAEIAKARRDSAKRDTAETDDKSDSGG